MWSFFNVLFYLGFCAYKGEVMQGRGFRGEMIFEKMGFLSGVKVREEGKEYTFLIVSIYLNTNLVEVMEGRSIFKVK